MITSSLANYIQTLCKSEKSRIVSVHSVLIDLWTLLRPLSILHRASRSGLLSRPVKTKSTGSHCLIVSTIYLSFLSYLSCPTPILINTWNYYYLSIRNQISLILFVHFHIICPSSNFYIFSILEGLILPSKIQIFSVAYPLSISSVYTHVRGLGGKDENCLEER